jgi:hypothetical protein
MLLLPNNLKCVAEFADKKDSGARWAVTGVQVEDHGDGKYTAVATDTKALIVVEGKFGYKADDYPACGALVDAPNGGTKGLIPAKLFAEVMSDSAKKTKSSRPALRSVALQMSAPTGTYGSDTYEPGQAVLGWNNLEQHATPTTKLCDGRFPPYKDILPQKKPLLKLALDPLFVIRMAKAMEAIKGLTTPENDRIELSFWAEQKPVLFEYQTEEQKTTVLIMPLASDFTRDDSVAQEAQVLAEEIVEAKCVKLNEENREQRDSIYDLKHELSLAKSENRVLECDRDELKTQVEDLEGRISGFQADMKGMESALLQVRLELSAALEDKEMYRQRAETVATQG